MSLVDISTRITRCVWWHYDVPLVRPLPRTSHFRRRGIILCLTDEDGRQGYGEVSPLPGWSCESLEDIEQELRALSRRLPLAEEDIKLFGIYPSLRFGLEMTLAWLEQWKSYPLHNNLLPVNGLLAGSTQKCLELAVAAQKNRCSSFKIKVGSGDFDEDVDKVLSVARVLGDGACLRLDANRAWLLTDALKFAKRISGVTIDYIEEPLQNPQELVEFAERSKMPIALDESLRELRPEVLLEAEDYKAIILKPTLLGGFKVCDEWARVALQRGIEVVTSAVFESELGLYALARWAGALPQRQVAVGLDTFSWWLCQLSNMPWDISDYKVNLASSNVELSITDLQSKS